MKAFYTNDSDRGPGYGFIELRDMRISVSFEGIRFTIKRASDQQSLGKGGWQPAENFLAPRAVTLAEEGISLAVGPEVVDNIDPTETYRLTILSVDNISMTGSLQVTEVAYSLMDNGQSTGAIYVPPRAAMPERELLPPPPSEPEPAHELESGPVPEIPRDPEPLPAEELPLPPPEPRKRSLAPVLFAVLALALAGGGFAVWKYLNKDAPAVAVKQSGREASPSDKKEEQAQRPENGKSEPQAPLSLAREHLGGSADPQKSFELAKRLRTEEKGADAAFLLAEDAAQKGNAEAMLMTGAYFDPVDSSPAGTILKDPAQAFAWYSEAESAGHPEAKNRLAALRVWAETEAEKGSAEAKDFLTRFK